MEKGKLGFPVWVYAALAFLAVPLGTNGLIAIAALVLFALLVEKNDWVNRQIFQALGLSIVYLLARLALDLVSGILNRIIYIGFIDTIFGLLGSLLTVLVIVFVILAIVRLAKGQDVQVLVFGQLFGGQKPAPAQPVQPVQPVQPIQQPAPVEQPVEAPAPVSEQPAPVSAPPAPVEPPKPVFTQPVQQPIPVEPVQQVYKPIAPPVQPAKASAPKFCPVCGKSVREGAKFCAGCGHKLG